MDYRKLVLVLGVLFTSFGAFAAPWDVLREPATIIASAEPVVLWILLLVSAGLLLVSSLALKKKPSTKLKWVTVAFGLFFIKSLLLVLDIYFSPGNFMNYSIQGFFDLLTMGSFFVALFRK